MCGVQAAVLVGRATIAVWVPDPKGRLIYKCRV